MFQEIKLTSRLYQIGDNYIGLFVISVNIGFNKIHLLSVHPLHYYGWKTSSVHFLEIRYRCRCRWDVDRDRDRDRDSDRDR